MSTHAHVLSISSALRTLINYFVPANKEGGMTTCKACGGEGHLPNKVLQIFLGPCYFFILFGCCWREIFPYVIYFLKLVLAVDMHACIYIRSTATVNDHQMSCMRRFQFFFILCFFFIWCNKTKGISNKL
jgi:hypothetical protein